MRNWWDWTQYVFVPHALNANISSPIWLERSAIMHIYAEKPFNIEFLNVVSWRYDFNPFQSSFLSCLRRIVAADFSSCYLVLLWSSQVKAHRAVKKPKVLQVGIMLVWLFPTSLLLHSKSGNRPNFTLGVICNMFSLFCCISCRPNCHTSSLWIKIQRWAVMQQLDEVQPECLITRSANHVLLFSSWYPTTSR